MVHAVTVVGCDCDGLLLTDPQMSRRHVQLEPAGAELTVTDLGSTNGTTTFTRKGRVMKARTKSSAALALGVLLMAAACSSSKPDASASSTTTQPSTTTAPATFDYSTRYLDPPLDLILPDFLDKKPSEETAHFVTWGAPDGSVAVRVLRPVAVYTPGSTTTSPVPTDYVTYLLGLTAHGAHFEDRVDTKVDGHDATIVSGTTDESIDGSMGCPETGMTAGDCFGLQPEFALRLAVIATDKGPLLIWLRSNADAPSDVAASPSRFDSFLDGLHFADRPVETPTTEAAVDTEYDGTYTWTITREDALAHGTPSDKTPEGLAVFPNTFTATLHNGRIDIRETSTSNTESDPYVASPGHVRFGDPSNGLTATVVRDPDGTLHLTAVEPILDAGGVFILTTEPWKPV